MISLRNSILDVCVASFPSPWAAVTLHEPNLCARSVDSAAPRHTSDLREGFEISAASLLRFNTDDCKIHTCLLQLASSQSMPAVAQLFKRTFVSVHLTTVGNERHFLRPAHVFVPDCGETKDMFVPLCCAVTQNDQRLCRETTPSITSCCSSWIFRLSSVWSSSSRSVR